MSLINEALKRAEVIGRNEEAPDIKRSTHAIEHLYADRATAGQTPSERAAEKEVSRLLQTKQTSLRGAAALGVCVIASVAVIMHLTLPPEQRTPIEAKAGGAIATLETQTPPAPEKTEAEADEAAIIPTIVAPEQPPVAMPDNIAQIVEITPLPEPVVEIKSVLNEQDIDDEPDDKFTISGIMASGGRGYAIVNGHMVTVGDDIDGAKVVTIGKHHVVLEKGGKRLTLRM